MFNLYYYLLYCRGNRYIKTLNLTSNRYIKNCNLTSLKVQLAWILSLCGGITLLRCSPSQVERPIVGSVRGLVPNRESWGGTHPVTHELRVVATKHILQPFGRVHPLEALLGVHLFVEFTCEKAVRFQPPAQTTVIIFCNNSITWKYKELELLPTNQCQRNPDTMCTGQKRLGEKSLFSQI